MRADGRQHDDELRPLDLIPDFVELAHGSVLYSQGKTRVLCTAMVEEGVPRWLHRSGRGWMTAEYSLLPASTGERVAREAAKGKQGGRTVEIQRLIGRALRSVCDFQALGERTLWLDCDVIQADGGTRCAAISGAYVAASRALDRFGLSKALSGQIAAVSVGVVEGRPLLDLDYSEDSTAETDMNVVMTADGRLVEVQATAEREPVHPRGARRDDRPRRRRDRGDHGGAERRRRRGARCLNSRPPRRCCGCSSPPASVARSGSSASCGITRRASARTCSSRSVRASSHSSPPTPGPTGRSRNARASSSTRPGSRRRS